MENYIDLINAYLNKTLSKTEVVAFENKLQSDTKFTLIYNEHLNIIKGIQRVGLKNELSSARQRYIRMKYIKYSSIAIVAVMLLVLIYSLITKPKTEVNLMPTENKTVQFASDSITSKKIIILKAASDSISVPTLVEAKVKVDSKKENRDVASGKEGIDDNNLGQNTIISFYDNVKKEAQIIAVNTEEAIKITLEEGTIISIPKDAFIDEKTGVQVAGEIQLQIKEYYKLSDILLANLSTKSDDRLLETGGMLYVEANKSGSKLKLNPNKPLNIVFNNSGKDNMQLFEGETNDNSINWRLNEKLESIEINELSGEFKQSEAVAVSLTDKPYAVEDFPTYRGCKDLDKDCTLTKIREFISRKFNTDIISGRKRISVIVKTDESGFVTEVLTSNLEPKLEAEVNGVLMQLPQMIPAKKNGKSIASQLLFPIVLSDGFEALLAVKSEKGLIMLNQNIGNASSGYTLNSTKLGWINCDRFLTSQKKTIAYKVKIKDAEGANVKMVFKSISSVLPSRIINGDYSFGEIPIDEDVILLAIKKKGDKLYLGRKNVEIKAISELDLEFKEVTIEELKSELKKLNKTFN
jgi:hypothetical protein